METSGKVNEMVESAGYTMEAFGNMSSVMESMIQELDEISGKVDEMNGRRHAQRKGDTYGRSDDI